MGELDIEQVQSLLSRALKIEDQEEQHRLVIESSQGNHSLQREVLGLLRYQQRLQDRDQLFSDGHAETLGKQLEELHSRSGEASSQGAGQSGDLEIKPILDEPFGPYRLIRVLGEGGMGVVYEAEQEKPNRRVAIKVIEGLGGVPSLHRRLELEAEILGRLHHPGIAQVYEAGSVVSGHRTRPYFAMELVSQARPISLFCEQEGLDTRARLELVARVSDAIGYAHERGVVHRDIKPENILMDSSGNPKVLDFGIATLSESATLVRATLTREGQILGTMGYMAPELLSGKPEEVTPGADVYAMGVVCFEILAGRGPYEIAGLGITAAVRLIEEQNPPRLGSLKPALRGEIETIVCRCLEKEPHRRYSNGSELAADIRRFLSDRPIQARRPSKAYRARKFVRRNRVLVGGVSATVLMLFLGVIVAAALAVREMDARRQTQAERNIARLNETHAISGLLSGGGALRKLNEPWSAWNQLSQVEQSRRGWEWEHLAMSLPWVQEWENIRAESEDADPSVFGRFVSDHELFGIALKSGRAVVRDLLTGEVRDVPIQGQQIRQFFPWHQSLEGQACVRLRDGRIGMLNTRTGVFENWHQGWAQELAEQRVGFAASRDGRITVSWLRDLLQIRRDGEIVYETRSGLSKADDLHWNPPVFEERERFLVLRRSGTPSMLTVVDLETFEETVRHEFNTNYVTAALSPDGGMLYHTTAEHGIEIREIPSFELVGTLPGGDGLTSSLGISPDGGTVFGVFNHDEALRLFNTRSGELIGSFPMGAYQQNDTPTFSPDGRLIRAFAPNERGDWIIDTQEQPTDDLTMLSGHRSWIYQLCVSPDGTLLASAAPEGDILLWDLGSNRLLARIQRFVDHVPVRVGLNMDAPLVFSPDGESLIYQELNSATGDLGLTRLQLESGERAWALTGDRGTTLDAVAAQFGDGVVVPLYHHAAKLRDGRILHANAAAMSGHHVQVRPPADKAGETVVFSGGTGFLVTSGVAAHPDGSVIASGEYQRVRIRDSETGESLHELQFSTSDSVFGMTYSPDGTRLAIGTNTGHVLIYDTEFYVQLASIQLPDNVEGTTRNYVFNLVWTPDGERLITCAQNSIRILESRRVFVRDARLQRWAEELEFARDALSADEFEREGVSPAALRIAQIERWAATELAEP